MNQAYGLYLSYHYWLLGQPLPVDIFIALTNIGFDPVELEEIWEGGGFPEGELIHEGDNTCDDGS